jgi:tetratricopeptide (TPR) repeat protein
LNIPTSFKQQVSGYLCSIALSAFFLITTGCAAGKSFVAIPSNGTLTGHQKKIMKAERWFVRARAYVMAGNTKKALHCYEKAYSFDPASGTLRLTLVGYYAQALQNDKALRLARGNTPDDSLNDDDKRLCAGIYFRQHDVNAAADMLIKVRHKRPEEQWELGVLRESVGDIEDAIHYYKAYLDSNVESVPLWIKIGVLYVQLKQYSEAESLFTAMDTKLGKRSEAYNARAKINLLQGDTLGAVEDFETAVELDSTSAEAYRNLAQIYIRKGKLNLGASWYEQLHRHSSTFETADGKTLAMLYFYLGAFDKAEPLLSGLLSDNSNDHELHFDLGLVLAAQEHNEAARMEFEKTLAINKLFPDAWQQLCILALQEKNDSLALETVTRFKQALPNSGTAWRIEGAIFNEQKNYVQAKASLSMAVALDSADASAWFELGISSERVKDKNTAEIAIQHVLGLHPGNAPAANFLGYMWAEDGIHLDSAKILLEQALEQEPNNGAYLDSYAWIWYKMGMLDSASATIQKAIGSLNDDPTVHAHYAEILRKQGKPEEALIEYRKSLGFTEKSLLSPEEIAVIHRDMDTLIRTMKNAGNSVPGAPGK